MRAALLDRFTRWLSGTPSAAPAATASTDVQPFVDTAVLEGALRESLTVPRLVAEPWYVDQVSIDGTRLSVAGWSMPSRRDSALRRLVQRQRPPLRFDRGIRCSVRT